MTPVVTQEVNLLMDLQGEVQVGVVDQTGQMDQEDHMALVTIPVEDQMKGLTETRVLGLEDHQILQEILVEGRGLLDSLVPLDHRDPQVGG